MYDYDVMSAYMADREAYDTPQVRFRREYEEMQAVQRAKSKLAAARARLDRVVAARLAS